MWIDVNPTTSKQGLVEQITKQLKSGTLDTFKIDGSVSTGNELNSIGSDILKENEVFPI
jgi:splicing factor 1